MICFPVLVLVLYVAVNAQGCPTIISKSQWGGKTPTCKKLYTPVENVFIHHTDGAYCNSKATCSTQAKNTQHNHMTTRNYCDVAYNFLIGEDGNVYEGRGWSTVGHHTETHNDNSIGIGFIGKFANREPNHAALNAAKELIACGVAKKFIRSNYVLRGHRNVEKTECPGNSLYNVLKKWPHFKA